MTTTDKAKGDVMRDAFEKAVHELKLYPDGDMPFRLFNGVYLSDQMEKLEKLWQAAAKHYSIPVACGWQPVRTAPYDTLCLFYTVDGHIIEDFIYDAPAHPPYTHWMPLPAPPGQHPTPLPAQDEAALVTLLSQAFTDADREEIERLDNQQYAELAVKLLRPYLRPTPPQVDIEAGARAICPSAFESWDRHVQYKLNEGATEAEAIEFAKWCDDGAHPLNKVEHARERAKACASAWGLTEGVKAPDLPALEQEIEALFKKIPSKHNDAGLAGYKTALIRVLEIIRQHAAQGGE